MAQDPFIETLEQLEAAAPAFIQRKRQPTRDADTARDKKRDSHRKLGGKDIAQRDAQDESVTEAGILELFTTMRAFIAADDDAVADKTAAIVENDGDYTKSITKLSAFSNPPKPTTPKPSGRHPLEIDPKADVRKLSGGEQTRVAKARAWIESQIPGIKRLVEGKNPQSGKDHPGNVAHIYNLRQLKRFNHACLGYIYLTGDKWALDLVVWANLRVIKSTTDRYVLPKGYSIKDKRRVAAEGVGLLRFIYWPTEEQGATDIFYTDDVMLEIDLTLGDQATVEYALFVNQKHGYEEAFETFSEFVTKHAVGRLKQLSKAWYGASAPWWKYGDDLQHAVRLRYAHHFFRYETHGDPEDKVARDFYGAAILKDAAYIQTDVGELLQFPHKCSMKAEMNDWRYDNGAADITYRGEDIPAMFLVYLCGSPLFSKRWLAAYGRAMHETVLCGPLDAYEGIAKTIGGKGTKDLHAKLVVATRDGKTYPSHLKLPGAGDLEGTRQVQRDNAMWLSHLVGSPAYKADLETLDKYAQGDWHANQLALLFYELQPQNVIMPKVA